MPLLMIHHAFLIFIFSTDSEEALHSCGNCSKGPDVRYFWECWSEVTEVSDMQKPIMCMYAWGFCLKGCNHLGISISLKMSRNKHPLKYTRVGIWGLIQCCCFWTFKSLWCAVIYFFSEEFTVFWKSYTHVLNLSVVVFFIPVDCPAAGQHQLIQLISC